jgi:hypothetical protein
VLTPAGFVRVERSLLLNVRAIAYAQPIGHGSFAFTLVSGARLHSGHAYRDTILAALPLRRRAPPRPARDLPGLQPSPRSLTSAPWRADAADSSRSR